MTKQGLPTARTAAASRQVADKSFFIGILREKINYTMKEIERLRGEIEQRKRGQSIQIALAEQVNDLRAQIASSEAELADYNVLADRAASGVSADDMAVSFQELEQANNRHEQEVNGLFREKRELDTIVVEQESQVQAMMRGAGSPELQEMAKEIERLDSQCGQLRGGAGDLQGKSREQLLAMVKDATARIGDCDREIQDEQRAVAYVQNQLKQLDESESDLQTDRGQQYLKLKQREEEMALFMQNFPRSVEQAKDDLLQCQRRVFDLLAISSRDLESMAEMPSIDNMKQLENDLEHKRRQLDDARSTAEKLMLEVEQRRQEYDNLSNVDVKITEEIQVIKQQMKQMEDELPNFSDVEAIREEGEVKKARLTKEREQLRVHLHQLRKATNGLASKYNETRSQLRTNDVNNKLHELEKEIRARAAENFAIIECIEDNRRRSNYSLIKRSSMSVVNEINNLL
jgi:intraflagellar transport protein 74